ncbi:ribonuclease Y 1-like isoform X1 [Centroberyx affinis]|uniref:ribonuclease Y 1-like isoform X1 n=1 Tax=Centroberyx affinis TaxID=166261 RepID=UPI003A5C5954
MDLPKGSSATRWVQSFFWSSKSKEPNDALLAEKDRQLQDKDKELERTKNMLREKDELLKMNKHQHTLLVEKDKQLQNELKKMKEQLREKDEQLEIKDKLVEEGNKHIEHQGQKINDLMTEIERLNGENSAPTPEKPTMEKFDTLVTGKTLESHKTFVRQLIQGGATEVDSPDNSDVTIVFCPIVSSVQTNIAAALSNISGFNPVILVVMHHTFNPNYTVPNSSRVVNNSSVVLVVDCLFYESRGLFDCQRNKDAVSEVLKKLCPY